MIKQNVTREDFWTFYEDVYLIHDKCTNLNL